MTHIKRRDATGSQLLSKRLFLQPLLDIHAELETEIVILVIQRLQQLQPVSFDAKALAQMVPDTV
jgi:hypothetical protein